ncbi:hypothetical protein JX265_004304 [Neoarthrinium moseri]|uniref:AB hydrolase-1 domain-containing protein n=1 Tax=Neoarthrinium moseri TaxID=1658444 RepID=A0A9P9WQW6_9PEZI|nr:uncharacterized protein JN550_001902 [Neoarthrinium moseri]KAI1850594.1 hypothetical protein JX266_003876 [Neoarthrinium moseri]KAI1875246.1 hypothetical protein JX265_004304 [Neoarthrinium moseri]KAI1875616.1 hypothetical protein JN550_001902 [Neoarthrinium moseri]
MKRMASAKSSGPSSSGSMTSRSRGGTETSNDSVVSSRAASVAESSWSTTSRVTSSTETDASPTDPPKELWFKTLNPYAPVTVVMLHLLFSSHLEWAHVWPKLTEYHLLIPDMPHHSRSRSIKPFSFALAADLIADMIRKHAHGGRAHLVGISTGGFVCQELVRRHPDVAISVFASGCSPLRDFWLNMSKRPKLIHLGLLAMLHTPNNMFLKVSGWSPELQNNDLVKEVKRNTTSRLSERGNSDTAAFQQEAVQEVATKGVRICLVAGGKQDDFEGTRNTGRDYRTLGTGEAQQSRAYIVREAIHAWNLQYPELYAKGIQAWIEKWQMPPEFELLE